MQNPIIVYESKYGFTKSYAQWISDALHCPIIPAAEADVDTLNQYDILIFGGGLYVGAISGISLLTGNSAMVRDKLVIVFTVGLGPVKGTDFGPLISKNFTPQMGEQIDFFHFRGGIDYHILSYTHKALLGLKRLVTILKPQKTQEELDFLRSYGALTDFRDEEAIKPLIDYITLQCRYVVHQD